MAAKRGKMHLLCIAALTMTGLVSAQDLEHHTPRPTRTPTPTATPTQTPTPTPSPTPEPCLCHVWLPGLVPESEPIRLPTTFPNLRGVGSRYVSVGSRWPLNPEQDLLFPIATHGLPPSMGSGGQGPQPNTWAPLNTQAVWQEGLWRPGQQDVDFASRVAFLLGNYSASLSNIESGIGRTRTEDNPFFLGAEAKYSMGALNHGSFIRGGSLFDDFRIIGASNYATTNFYDLEMEPGHVDPAYRRAHIFGMAGIEGFTMIGPGVSGDLGVSPHDGPVDGRFSNLRPEDVGAPSPAIINFMFGISGASLVDNQRCDDFVGRINNAWGGRAVVGSATARSWINVGLAAGLVTQFFQPVGEGANPAPPGHFCDNCERPGSVVESYVAILSFPPDHPDFAPIPIEGCPESSLSMLSSTGRFSFDHDPTGSGGAPLLVPDVADRNLSFDVTYRERYTDLITRGSVVVGDGYDDGDESGYGTDVLHVNDLLHLHPRTEPPELSDKLLPSDRVGLMYFDATRNRLRVSIALPEEDARDRSKARVGWVDIPVDMSSITPERDIASGVEEQRARISEDEVAAADERAREQARRGESPFVSPKLEVLLGAARAGEAPMTLITSGFGARQPLLYYRALGAGHDRKGETDWVRHPTAELAVQQDLGPEGGVYFGTMRFDREALRVGGRTPSPGQRIQFLAVDPETGEVAGHSAVLY